MALVGLEAKPLQQLPIGAKQQAIARQDSQ